MEIPAPVGYDLGTMIFPNAKSDRFTRGLLERRPACAPLLGILKP